MKIKKDPLLVKFGNLVHVAREKKGISQEALGFELNLHRTYIGMIERAERSISLLQALKIIRHLNIDIKDLYDEDSKTTNRKC